MYACRWGYLGDQTNQGDKDGEGYQFSDDGYDGDVGTSNNGSDNGASDKPGDDAEMGGSDNGANDNEDEAGDNEDKAGDNEDKAGDYEEWYLGQKDRDKDRNLLEGDGSRKKSGKAINSTNDNGSYLMSCSIILTSELLLSNRWIFISSYSKCSMITE